jgi:hypothetical protein
MLAIPLFGRIPQILHGSYPWLTDFPSMLKTLRLLYDILISKYKGYYENMITAPLSNYYGKSPTEGMKSQLGKERIPAKIPFDQRTDDELRGKPREPGSEDCCMSGCQVCVWDVYNKELEEYNKRMGITSSSANPGMDAFLELERQLKRKASL